MLEATADANNRNAYDLAINEYRNTMDQFVGPEAPFVKESQLSVSMSHHSSMTALTGNPH